jgi:hypothetical protein
LLGAVLSARDGGSGRPGDRTARTFSSFPEYELDLVGYAQVQGTARCLVGAGFPQLANVELPPPDRRTSHVQVNLGFFGPTSMGYARTYGFGPGLSSDWQPPQLLDSHGGFGNRLTRCQERAWRAIDPYAREVYLDYVALSGVVSSEYGRLMTEAIRTENLNADLLDCLTGEGYEVLDRAAFLANPYPGHFGIKTGTLEASSVLWRPPRGTGILQVTAADLPARYAPAPEEAEFAVAFAGCNHKTGRLERLQATSRQTQDMIMREHETEMTTLNTKLAPLARRAAALTGLH